MTERSVDALKNKIKNQLYSIMADKIKLLYIDLFCGAGGTSTGVELNTDYICIINNILLYQRTMKILKLPLKKEWYNMIESGEKREEYREVKPYWSKRLVGVDKPLFSHRYGYQHANVKGYTHVLFRYGYTKRTMVFKIDDITIGRGNPNWGAPTDKDDFIISFTKKFTKSYKNLA